MKNRYSKFTTVLAVFILITGSAAAVQTQPEKAPQKNPNFEMTPAEKPGLFSGIFDNLLSLVISKKTVEPGSTVEFDSELTLDDGDSSSIRQYDSSNLVKIVEIYRCDDLSCDDPNPFVEADRDFTFSSSEYWDGDSIQWQTRYTVPEQESTYEAVSYIYHKDMESIVSTVSETDFQVTTGSSSSSSKDVVSPQSPKVTVSGNTVTGTVSLKNNGGDMPGTDIVEMQVRPGDKGPLSFVSREKVCDSNHPENVHKEFSLQSGESVSFQLDTQVSDGTYTVYFLTRDACAPDNGRVQPFYYSFNAGKITVGSDTGTGANDMDADGVVDSNDNCPERPGPSSNNGCPKPGIPFIPITVFLIISGIGVLVFVATRG